MRKKLRVLCACEESQTFCLAFRKLGCLAYSADLKMCSGGHPEWHVQGDVLRVLYAPVRFTTCDGKIHSIKKWDLLLAFPPCTYLTICGAVHLFRKTYCNLERYRLLKDAVAFFRLFLDSSIPYKVIENPVPLKITKLPKPDTYIQPFWFGDPWIKKTCLWLTNLPPPFPTSFVYTSKHWIYTSKYRDSPAHSQTARSKTFLGFATAASIQWYEYICQDSERSE